MEVVRGSCQCQFPVASGGKLGFLSGSDGSFLSSRLLVQIKLERCQRAIEERTNWKTSKD
jgi:hypothetical protein